MPGTRPDMTSFRAPFHGLPFESDSDERALARVSRDEATFRGRAAPIDNGLSARPFSGPSVQMGCLSAGFEPVSRACIFARSAKPSCR
jgi:hypothetical protein